MSNKNKLIGLSLIALATLCACNDDNYADGKGNRLVTFSVNAKANGGWSDINGSRSAWMSPQAQQMGEPVEMEGKLNGKTVYLTSEVIEGFPSDNATFTRGTQITNADGMSSSFGVTAFLGSQKYMDHVEIKKSNDSWKPQTDYFWLNGKSLDFYAWYPYNSAEGTNGIPSGMTLNKEDFSSISYTVPTDVSKQEDLMFAVNKNVSEPTDGNATSLDFKHSLAAVKFVVGDLPTGTKVTSVALKGVKYKGDLAVTAGNNGEAQLAWSNLANETRDFTQATTKEVKENDTDNAITKEDQTFFMMPQTLPDGAIVEVVVENQKGESATLTGALQDATAAVGAKNKWEAGNTYTYRVNSSGVQAEVTFFDGIKGLNGQPYTSHNISANGDPFKLTLKYPNTVEKITARIAYETKETSADGSTTYKYEEIKQYENLMGKNEHSLTSPCMNNKGDETHAKEKETPFVVQIKIKASAPLRMPTDPDRPGEYKYHPGSDDETWFTIWRGTMFPPNYVLKYTYCSVYVSRKNMTYNGNLTASVFNMRASSQQYSEVDENHPKFGKGKFDFNNITGLFNYNGDTFQGVSWAIACWMKYNQAPSNKAIYGEKFIRNHYWSFGCNGGAIYWIFNYQMTISSPQNWWTAEHYYSGYGQNQVTNSQMCSVDGYNSGVCARGFAGYW
ncbi:fimbrillin family protein [Prevotella copri]|uniref:Fimbrillin family protein n=1 Tax=Segatella copri TaxID=165179 RepID=A0AA90UEG6_9BACT|nr:fimbrillin family protein [Segatella copri]MQN12400.1 fimbrillin family protein [Segatella copri]